MTAATYGEVKELQLIQLIELIEMVEKHAMEQSDPDLIDTMNCVLDKFHLSCYKKIKYTDYRSAFSELQRQGHDMREMSYKEQSLQKFRPEDPWKRWTIPRNLATKTLAANA